MNMALKVPLLRADTPGAAMLLTSTICVGPAVPLGGLHYLHAQAPSSSAVHIHAVGSKVTPMW